MSASSHKILVHTCCTACASHVFSELTKAGFEVTAFFYNPELEQTEYSQRLLGLRNYCDDNEVKLITPDYKPDEFNNVVAPFRDKNSLKYINELDRFRRRRCLLCNSLVLQKTIEQAKSSKVKFFTTTLLCSPYKNHDEIIEISNDKALDYELNFYYQDFRKGYWKGRNYAKNHQIISPSCCGCADSAKEGRLE